MEIGDSLGEVNKFVDISNMVGGNFTRIQVIINITQPVCRGRIISLGVNDDRFISFKYERLPNTVIGVEWLLTMIKTILSG